MVPSVSRAPGACLPRALALLAEPLLLCGSPSGPYDALFVTERHVVCQL